ncbi:MAG: SpoIIE family protein phosphatase [Ruminococcus sp.]
MKTYLPLIATSLFPVLFTLLIYFAEKKTAFRKLPYMARQIVMGIVFGGLAILSTTFGIDLGGAEVNSRDASILSAGLIFGGPAGIIAGLIGGIHRFVITLWGIGEYTGIACSIASIVAGLLAGCMRKIIFDNKMPNWVYSLALAVTTESLHMLLVLITNMGDIYTSFEYVRQCALPMTICTALSVVISVILISLLDKEKKVEKAQDKKITHIFHTRLFVCFFTIFALFCTLTLFIGSDIAKEDTNHLLNVNLKDIKNSIEEIENKNLSDDETLSRISNLAYNWHIGEGGCIIICDKNGKIISDSEGHNGEYLWGNGKDINKINIPEGELFTRDIHGESSLCIYNISDDYCILATLPVEEATITQRLTIYGFILMEVIIFSALLFLIYYSIKRVVVENIHKVNNSLVNITDGDLSVKVNVQGAEEFSSLSRDINKTVDALKGYIAQAEARIDKELEIARQIQHSALPSVFPPYPNRQDFDIFASMHTAKEVGGDFYDFYLLGENRLAILIADVSGKGIPAAMFMMTAKTQIKGLVESGLEVDEVLKKANNRLCENNEAGMFLTCWLGILDLETGLLKYVNAGHNPPVVRHGDGNFEYFCTNPNFLLASIENISYKSSKLQLYPRDRIFLYTDGVTEAIDSKNTLFGADRLLESLNTHSSLPVKELCSCVKKDVDSFAGDVPQFDDITMLALKINYLQSKDTITLKPDSQSIDDVYRFVDNRLKELGIDKKTDSKAKIVVDEIYSNIVNYSKATLAKISIDRDENILTLKFQDNGTPYNPLKSKSPDVTLSSQERKVGGLGIHLVKNISHEMTYSHPEGMNTLTVKLDFS